MKIDGPSAEAPAALGHATRPAKQDADAAAKQLEAFFLRQLLAETRPKGATLDGGFAGDTFKQMFDEAIADKMSAAGGIGVAAMFARQLGKSDEVAAAPAPPIERSEDLGGGDPTGSAGGTGGKAPRGIAHLPLGTTGTSPAGALDGMPPFVVPVAGRASSGYGLRTDPVQGKEVNHAGLDLAAAAGTQVTAAAGGTVVHAGPAGTYGNLVTLRHENGFETRYAHLSAVEVKLGDVIESGQALGKVGSTGHSTGPHLHFEIRQDGHAIDPAPLMPLHSFRVRTSR